MRARRHFQPSLDSLPMRLAPSNMGVMVSPLDPLAGSSSSPTAIVSPMDPVSGPVVAPRFPIRQRSVQDPYTPPATTILPC